MCHSRAQNGPFVLNKIFLVQIIIITFIYLLASTSFSKIYKNSYSKSRVMRMGHFWAQNGPFAPPPKKIFFWKIINIILIYLSAPFIVQNFKKFFQQSQSYEDVQCLGPKWPISPNENFFRKPINEPCFFHSCLSTCQKSKLDIDLLVKY